MSTASNILQTAARVLNHSGAPRASLAVTSVRMKLTELLEAEAEFDAALAGYREMTRHTHTVTPTFKHDDPRLVAYSRAVGRRQRALEALR